MNNKKISTYIASGFIGGVAFIVGCGSDSVVSAADSLWESVGSTIFYTAGNVGIGTNTPQAALDVKGQTIFTSSGAIADDFVFETSSNNDANIKLKMNSGDASESVWAITARSSGAFTISKEGVGNSILANDSGFVGIGNDSPMSPLAVGNLPTSAPDASGNAGVVCVTNDGNFWLDNDGTADCS